MQTRLLLTGALLLPLACSSDPSATETGATTAASGGDATGTGAGGAIGSGGVGGVGGAGGAGAAPTGGAGGSVDGCGELADPMTLGLGDADSHPPPTDGAAPYSPPGSWLPGSSGFVGLGETFTDPVFGSELRRITDVHPGSSGSEIYVRNGFWNADGTRFMHHRSGCAADIVDTATGQIVQSGVPGCFRASFDPVDPAALYYPSGSSLMRYDVTTGDATTLKDFGGTLQSLGGSLDYIDRSGRYFVVNVAGAVQVWDKEDDVLYAGTLSGAQIGTGWVGITPDGNYLVTPGDFEFRSYAIDHGTQSVDTTGTLFWTLCGDHADLVSTSDGKSYLVGFECWSESAIYRIDITLPQSAENDAARQKQRDDNVMLVDIAWEDHGHISCATKGPNKDWCFFSVTGGDDTFGNQGAWRPYKQEILMMQTVEPFAVRRLAHHRSRSPHGSYQWQPRVSTSFCGNIVGWLSNFGDNSSSYADVYTISMSAP